MRDKAGVTPETLMRMATYYLARHSASAERVREILARKVARRLALAEQEPLDRADVAAMIEPVIERLTRVGLLDDAAFARGRATSLAAKGRPTWRIRADLAQAGVEVDGPALEGMLGDLDPVAQAMILARRKRLGPFRSGPMAPYRDRDLAKLVRAGFAVGVARRVVDGDPSSREGGSDVDGQVHDPDRRD